MLRPKIGRPSQPGLIVFQEVTNIIDFPTQGLRATARVHDNAAVRNAGINHALYS